MSAETSMSVLTARPVVAALEAHDVDAARVLRLAELSSDALASIDTRLPSGAVLRLWEEAAAAACDPSFGVHVAETLPAGRTTSTSTYSRPRRPSATVSRGSRATSRSCTTTPR